MKYDEELVDELIRLVAAEIEVSDNTAQALDEGMISWIGEDLRNGMSGTERVKDEMSATSFARRPSARLAVRRAEKVLPARELRHRAAPVMRSVSTSLAEAFHHGCAT